MKDAAMTLLKVAISLLPELGTYLADLIDLAPDGALTDDIRSILPIKSETEKALEKLNADH